MRLMLIFALVAVFLCSCANHDNDYLKEGGSVSSIVVPAGVPPIKQEPYYPIPTSTVSAPTKPVSLTPATLTSAIN